MKSESTTPITILGVHHLALNCHDLAAQERFYSEVLGFRRVAVFRAGTPRQFVMLRLGAVCLELFTRREPGERVAGGEQIVGFKHLAFAVPDLDASMEDLRRRDITIDDVRDWSAVVPGFRVCFFRDPEGNILELLAGWQDPVGSDG